MSILWLAGEDVDFPNGLTVQVSTLSTSFRSGYARCGVYGNGSGPTRSQNFAAAAVTSCWLCCRITGATISNQITIGLTKDSSSNAGLWIGTASAGSTSKVALHKYDGTTKTQLATESGTSLGTGVPTRLDVQLVNYGASALVNVYLNYVLLISFSGDVTVSGVTSVRAVGLGSPNVNGACSEMIVSDSDTRTIAGLQTLALTAAGTTANWTNNTFSNINGTTLSDTNPTSSNTAAQVQDYNVTDIPTGVFSVPMVKTTARMAKSATPAVNQVTLGYNNGSGSSGSASGATKAVTTAYASYEQFDAVNPITAAAWVYTDINNLQLELTAQT